MNLFLDIEIFYLCYFDHMKAVFQNLFYRCFYEIITCNLCKYHNMYIFTTRRYASAVYDVIVCVCLLHSVLYQNG